MHVNKLNGKRYIGITSQKVEYRWNHGDGYRQNPHFNSAIQKYGWEAFEHIVLHDNLTEREAKTIEMALISKWHTQDREYGYNATAGGDGLKGFVPSNELRQLWSKVRTGKTRSEETKRRMSKSTALRRPDVMQKSAEAKYKSVSVFTLDGHFLKRFHSITAAANELGLTSAQKAHISDCCKGVRKSSGGYKWKYA